MLVNALVHSSGPRSLFSIICSLLVFPIMMKSQPKSVSISMKGSVSPEFFKKCGLPSLKLEDCDLGDKTLRSIISSCKNLRFLRVVLKNIDDTKVSFCSPKMLHKLNISRENLETFEIFSQARESVSKVDTGVSEWRDVLEAFFRVFPNIVRFSFGPLDKYSTGDTFEYGLPSDEIPKNHDPFTRGNFQFGFSKELSTADEGSWLAETIAYSLFTNTTFHRQALRSSAALKLTSVSLLFSRDSYEAEDADVLMKFFAEHNSLKFAKIMFKDTIDTEILKTILFQILEHCSSLVQLKYCTHMRWLHTLRDTEVSRFCKHLKQRKLSMEDNLWSVSGSSLTAKREFGHVTIDQKRQFILNFVQHCDGIQHLDIEGVESSDAVLQTIFQYQTDLKKLSIRFDYHDSTNFGMTGRHGSRPGLLYNVFFELNKRLPGRRADLNVPYNESQKVSPDGFSISRLQSLEELELFHFRLTYMDDTIFYHLVFPNLRYLRFTPPENREILLDLATSMPSLEKVDFVERVGDYTCLVEFCARLKKLHTLILSKDYLSRQTTDKGMAMSKSDIRKAFEVCPTLKIIYGDGQLCAVYDESKKSKITPPILVFDGRGQFSTNEITAFPHGFTRKKWMNGSVRAITNVFHMMQMSISAVDFIFEPD